MLPATMLLTEHTVSGAGLDALLALLTEKFLYAASTNTPVAIQLIR